MNFTNYLHRWKVDSDEKDRSSSSIYENMAETMNDLSQSYYSLKRNSIQTKNFNNNDNTVITSTAKYNLKPHHDSPQRLSPTNQPHRQKVTVKMVPAASRTTSS